MSLLSKIGDKVGELLLGNIITDFGTLPVNQGGGTVSITLRKQKTGHLNLVFQWQTAGRSAWETLEATPEVVDKLEAILQETRKQIGSSPSS